MAASEKRRASELVRVTPEVKAQLQVEMEHRGLGSINDAIESMMPADTRSVATCRYCGKITASPHLRHRFHEPTCSLYLPGKDPTALRA